MARLCICLGLRISECLALKWCDVDWLNGTLRVERGIVEQNVDDVKTGESRRTLTIASELLDVLKLWKQATPFPSAEDWMFASPLNSADCPTPTPECGGNCSAPLTPLASGISALKHVPAHVPHLA